MTGSKSPDNTASAAWVPSTRDRLEDRLLRCARILLRILPLTWASRVGAGFGWFLFSATRFQRARALANLDIAFGKTLSSRERWRVAGRCYQHFGSVVTEMLSESRLKRGEVLQHMTLVNPELMRDAVRQGKGVLLATAHFGSWGLLGPAMVDAGFTFSVFTGGQRNLLVDEQINSIRASMGMHGISRAAGARALLRALKAGHVVGLIADQHESTKRHYVSFFGQPVSVAPGPYALARHTGAPVVYGTSVRMGPFRFRATFEAIQGPSSGVLSEAEAERDLLEFLQRLIAQLERDARAYPEQYLWMHRRFRPIPTEVTLTPVNRAFLEGKLSGPVDSFWEVPEK